MSDFLHNLRTGNQKQYDHRSRRQGYDNQRYNKGNERHGRDKRRNFQTFNMSYDQFATLRGLMEAILDAQNRQLELTDRQILASERQATALETISAALKGTPQAESVVTPQVSPVAPDPVVPDQPNYEPIAEDAVEQQPLERSQIVALIRQLREEGTSYEKIAQNFEQRRIPTLSGKGKWRAQTIYRLNQEA